MSDCLHCDINELVRERIEGQENVDLGDVSQTDWMNIGYKDSTPAKFRLQAIMSLLRSDEAILFYYWLDPKKRIAAVFMTQVLPIADHHALRVYRDFERGVYRAVGAA